MTASSISRHLSRPADLHHAFAFEIGVGKPGVHRPGGDGALRQAETAHQGGDFLVEVAAFEVEDAAGEFALDPRVEVRQGGDGARNDEVEAVREALRAGIDDADIGKPHALGHFRRDEGLLAHGVAEGKPGAGEQDGQRDARETAAGAEVEDGSAGEGRLQLRTELQVTGDGQGMEDMMVVEVVDVLPGNDVDPPVPFPVQAVQGGELRLLGGGQRGEGLPDERQE